MNPNVGYFQMAPWMLTILRIVAAFLFMEHGGQKLFNFPPLAHPMSHLPPLMLAAGILEFFGGLPSVDRHLHPAGGLCFGGRDGGGFLHAAFTSRVLADSQHG